MENETREIKKVTKWITSLMAERAWLEEMSMEGWFLKDIRMGIRYTFEKGEPRHMAYDVDRFDLPKNPTRREIEQKADFLDMAEETGWSLVCHDEGQNYYLTKPWEEGAANEFYDSSEDRMRRSEHYKGMFADKLHIFLGLTLLMQVMGILFYLIPDESGVGWFPVFVMGYTAFCMFICIVLFRWSRLYERELRYSLEEWKAIYGKKDSVVRRKFILTIGGLEKYLSEQSAAGYHIKNMRIFRFTFACGEPEDMVYMMDSRHLTNKRRKKAGSSVFKDSRDWEERNNDWQVQSLQEAESAGWEFVGAVESRNILYRAKASSGAVPLNESGGIRITSAFGGMAVMMVIAGLAGGIIGGLVGYFVG